MTQAAGQRPVILNFDSSAGALPQALSLDLTAWQERIRFGCTWRAYNALCAQLEQALPAAPQMGTVFLGSGDYHHISYFLLKRLGESGALRQKIRLVVLDNHPDNMRYPFGIHCGSWVSYAAALPFVAHIDVVGISSADIALAHAVENRLLPLLRGRLTYWSVGVNAGWARAVGLGRAFRNFDTAEALAAAFSAEQAALPAPVYLSVDKDVLSPAVVRTNWDQGVMDRETLFALIAALKSRLIGSDVVGDVSHYRYKSPFKRFMSRLDGQQSAPPQALAQWQKEQAAFNRALAAALA